MDFYNQVSEQLACGSCGSTAAAGTPYPDPNASGGVHGVLCEGIYLWPINIFSYISKDKFMWY